jgi:hypothetical protein
VGRLARATRFDVSNGGVFKDLHTRGCENVSEPSYDLARMDSCTVWREVRPYRASDLANFGHFVTFEPTFISGESGRETCSLQR